MPEPVSRALDLCRNAVPDDPDLTALLDREQDLLDLLALNGDFPVQLTTSYTAIAADAGRRTRYLDLLAGFHRIEGRRPSEVEPQIADLVDALLADHDLRTLVAGVPAEPGDEHDAADAAPGPTLEQLLPDPAQREVVRRTLAASGVLP